MRASCTTYGWLWVKSRVQCNCSEHWHNVLFESCWKRSWLSQTRITTKCFQRNCLMASTSVLTSSGWTRTYWGVWRSNHFRLAIKYSNHKDHEPELNFRCGFDQGVSTGDWMTVWVGMEISPHVKIFSKKCQYQLRTSHKCRIVCSQLERNSKDCISKLGTVIRQIDYQCSFKATTLAFRICWNLQKSAFATSAIHSSDSGSGRNPEDGWGIVCECCIIILKSHAKWSDFVNMRWACCFVLGSYQQKSSANIYVR